MYDRLQEKGVPAQLVIVKNAGHSFIEPNSNTEPSFWEINQIILDFLAKYMP
jgi:dipeptidyl aminopeptidase/acylaminoacyl peptidase